MKQTFLYAVCGVILVTAFSGCAGINSLLKSGQPELIYSKALEYYQKEKWSRASTLFEGVQHYYIGTPREDSVSFFNARCKFKNRDYDTASALFDDFRRKFGRSAFIEDAEGMYALCFYYLSPGPSRDQTSPKSTSSLSSANLGAKSCRASLPAVCLTMMIPPYFRY